MECVYLSKARYLGGKIFLRFNTGEAGEVDLGEIVHRYEIAKPLRDPVRFAQFHLDSCPTLAWDCGFDIAPESLYSMVTGKDEQEEFLFPRRRGNERSTRKARPVVEAQAHSTGYGTSRHQR